MTIPAAGLFALLMATGFAPPQSQAIVDYAWTESRLQPCASSWMGEGLIGVAGHLRRALHAHAGTAGCVTAEAQVAFLAERWPALYPECSRRFAEGDLTAFGRCWGRGRRR